MITLSISSFIPFLCEISPRRDPSEKALNDDYPDIIVRYSPFGLIVLNAILEFNASHPEMQICDWIIMPDHIHFILNVYENLKKSMKKILSHFKGICTNNLYEASQDPGSNCRRLLPAGYFREIENLKEERRHSPCKCIKPTFWKRGVNDRIIFNDGEYKSCVAYIPANPQRYLDKKFHREFFFNRRVFSLPGAEVCAAIRDVMTSAGYGPLPDLEAELLRSGFLSTPASPSRAGGNSAAPIAGSGNFASRAGGNPAAPTAGSGSFASRAGGNSAAPIAGSGNFASRAAAGEFTLHAVGNAGLLEAERMAALRFSRRFSTADLQRREAAWRSCAAAGGVIVSPFIHERERALRLELQELGASTIKICPNGFPERYRPGGADFDLCCQGRLLLIGPPRFEAEKDLSRISRTLSLALNALAWLIAARRLDLAAR